MQASYTSAGFVHIAQLEAGDSPPEWRLRCNVVISGQRQVIGRFETATSTATCDRPQSGRKHSAQSACSPEFLPRMATHKRPTIT